MSVAQQITNLIQDGSLTETQARQLKNAMGFVQSDYTRSSFNREKRNIKNKMQHESRKKNRGLGKGQKRSRNTHK